MLKEGNKIGEEDEVTSPSKNKCPSEGYAKQNTLPDRSAMQAKVGGSDGGGRGRRRFRLLGDAREGDRLVVLPDGEHMNSTLQTMHVDEVLLALVFERRREERKEKRRRGELALIRRGHVMLTKMGAPLPLALSRRKDSWRL